MILCDGLLFLKLNFKENKINVAFTVEEQLIWSYVLLNIENKNFGSSEG